MDQHQLNRPTSRGYWILCGCCSIAVALLAACGGTLEEAPAGASGACAPGAALCPTAAPSPVMDGAGATPLASGNAASPNIGASNSGATTTTPNSADGVPCNVAQAVSNNCTQCHSAVPKFGATMPLMKLADFHAVSPSDANRKVFQTIPERINSQDSGKLMPPTSSMALSDADHQALDAWTSGGAIASSDVCAITETSIDGETAAIPTANPTTGISTSPIEFNDPNMECFKFLAHAQGSKDEPYSVSTQPDLLVSFNFMAPWGTEMRYVRAMKAIIDEERVVHHWLLYRTMRAGTDGEVVSSTGVHPDGSLMHGWAPGGDDLYFREDLAQEMPGDVAYTLEFHYNNATGGPLPDASGIEVCVTTEAPENVLGNSWLGTDRITGTSAEGTCDPSSDEPIQVLALQPHMHKSGMHFKAVLTRADGMQEVLLDAPFSFDDQRYYINEFKLMEGDTITSTCSYSEPAMYGASTNQEMCYLYALYYPRLSLTNGNALASSLHGPDTCLE
jgi:hypothetical protein